VSQPIYLLDTSVILPLVRGSALGRYIDQRFRLRSATQRPLVSVVSLGEVRVLAARNGSGEGWSQRGHQGRESCRFQRGLSHMPRRG
jgi:hypothetical protein